MHLVIEDFVAHVLQLLCTALPRTLTTLHEISHLFVEFLQGWERFNRCRLLMDLLTLFKVPNRISAAVLWNHELVLSELFLAELLLFVLRIYPHTFQQFQRRWRYLLIEPGKQLLAGWHPPIHKSDEFIHLLASNPFRDVHSHSQPLADAFIDGSTAQNLVGALR